MNWNNKEEVKKYHKEWEKSHRKERKLYYESRKEEIKLYNETNKEEIKLCKKKWYENHKEELKDLRYNIKYIVLLYYSIYNIPKCACCQESNINFLGLDHINGDGAKHRKSIKYKGSYAFYRSIITNNFPLELENIIQVLCHSCNKSKWTRKLCIHQRKIGFIQSNISSQKKCYIKRKHKCLVHYSKSNVPFCVCCGETEEEFLSFDHINGEGKKHFKKIGSSDITLWIIKNNFPPILRVLCMNCNKATAYNRICPHKLQKFI